MAGGQEIADLMNQALDSIGWPEMVGDPEEGSSHAQVALRQYWNCRQQLLRAAHWDFAMLQAPMTLLADASGNTPLVGTVVPFNWLYEYAYPTNCMKMRYVPANLNSASVGVPSGNIAIPSTPQTTGSAIIAPGAPLIPARFRISTDPNYIPAAQGADVQGVSPQSQTVVLTNVKDAVGVYTADMLYPSVWDSLFREALVAYLGAQIAVPVWTKKDQSQKTGIAARDHLLPIVRDKLNVARVQNGNEGVSSSDIAVDWVRARNVGGMGSANWGGYGGAWWGDGGIFFSGYDSLMIAGGATL